MPSDYRYDPFNNIAEPIAITGETHIIPSNSPYTIRLAEVPVRESPSTVTLTIAGIAATEVAAEPAAGQFRCDYTTGADEDDNWNTGLIQFNAADAGKIVVAAYNGMGCLVSADYRGHQLFTASGTFTVPKGVTTVYVTGCGGGGGGGGAKGDGDTVGRGGGGGGGACAIKTAITVAPGQSYAVTVGNAGSAGATAPTAGGAGGTSSFGALLSLSGGGGGGVGNLGSGAGGSAGNSYASAGGVFGTFQDYGSPAMGGSGVFGVGCSNFSVNAGNYTISGSVGSGFGSGGGGTYAYTGNGAAGGAGKQGFILVEW